MSKTFPHHIDLRPKSHAQGAVRLPGSKSISNRALMLAALARGTTTLRGVLDSDDTQVMRAGLGKLGVGLEQLGEDTAGNQHWKVTGCGGRFQSRSAALSLGNAGTAVRSLTAALAMQNTLQAGETADPNGYVIDGVARMRERPIRDLVDGLRQAGCSVDYLMNEGFPPLRLNASHVRTGQDITVRGDVSSQFLSGLLMALPLTGQANTLHVDGELISKPYVAMTLEVMRKFGVAAKRDDWSLFAIPGMTYSSPGQYEVEGDLSSASYFLAAGAISGSPCRVDGAGKSSIQGDLAFCNALEAMGATIEMGDGVGNEWLQASRAAGSKLKAIQMDFNHIPDAAMTIAVLALFAEGTTKLTNIASWRVKETDRIHAMATELAKLGAIVESGPDWLSVTPVAKLNHNVAIDTYDDHRIAMCFSLVSLAGVPITINDPKCVAKTVPHFFEMFESITK
jgi:3-phosphoshikimate 1-carboxyvinyltransferase